MSSDFTPPSECPVCGAEVPRGAKACPGCGADERTGWNEDATRYDGLDLPEEAFTDDGGPVAPRPARGGRLWLAIVVIAVVLLGLSLILH